MYKGAGRFGTMRLSAMSSRSVLHCASHSELTITSQNGAASLTVLGPRKCGPPKMTIFPRRRSSAPSRNAAGAVCEYTLMPTAAASVDRSTAASLQIDTRACQPRVSAHTFKTSSMIG
jgi:hypothetical protein